MALRNRFLGFTLAAGFLAGLANAAQTEFSRPPEASTPVANLYGHRLPDAQKLAIYQTTAQFYLDNVQKKHPDLLEEFTNYLVPTDKNKGKPLGYEIYLGLIDAYNSPTSKEDPHTLSALDVVRRVAKNHFDDLSSKEKAQ